MAKKLRHSLLGHKGLITRIIWSPGAELLISGSNDRTIKVWSAETGNLKETFPSPYSTITNLVWSPDGISIASGSIYEDIYVMAARTGMFQGKLTGHSGWITSIAWSSDGGLLASSCADEMVRIWSTKTFGLEKQLKGHKTMVGFVAWSPKADMLATGSSGGKIRIWDRNSWEQINILEEHKDAITWLIWSPDGAAIATASADDTIRVWQYNNKKSERILKSELKRISCLSYSFDGSLLAAMDESGLVCVWECQTWEMVDDFTEPSAGRLRGGLAFHPKRQELATISEKKSVINIWELLHKAKPKTAKISTSADGQYVMAKLMVAGDIAAAAAKTLTSISKASQTSNNCNIITLEGVKVKSGDKISELREIALWDVSILPNCKVAYQSQMDNVAAAIVFLEVTGKSDPFAGVRYWNQAINQSFAVHKKSDSKLKKVLVVVHPNPQKLQSSLARIKAVSDDMGFERFIVAKNKNWKNIPGLADLLYKLVAWDEMPKVGSINLYNDVKAFLLAQKESGLLLSNVTDLHNAFVCSNKSFSQAADLREQFDVCVRNAGAAGFVRKLNFEEIVLFKPELLNIYVEALIKATGNEPEGLGNLSEEAARAGSFKIPSASKIKDQAQESRLLIAAVEELVHLGIAVRETTNRGQLLVVPRQLAYRNVNMDAPKDKASILQFKGPALNVFAALIVNIAYSGNFKKKDLLMNAATFASPAGGTCGILLRKRGEFAGEIVLFFDATTSGETRSMFDSYVQANLTRIAMPGSASRQQVFACHECGEVIADRLVKKRQELGRDSINCPVCDTSISLAPGHAPTPAPTTHVQQQTIAQAPAPTPPAPVKVEKPAKKPAQTEQPAEAKPSPGTQTFLDWAGSSKGTFAIVFTDILGSSVLGNKLGNEKYREVRKAHFEQAREFLNKYDGYEIKTIGDSVMAAFRTAAEVLDFGLDLFATTGNPLIKIRVGIHIGPVSIEQNDAFGITVNYAARVEGMAKGAEVWVSNEAKTHIDQEGLKRHDELQWTSHDNCELKGFQGKHKLWSIANL